jgi:hypothetical protein
LITKAQIVSIDRKTNYCTVNIPLFQNASSTLPVKAEALINIPPGIYHNFFEGDIVFVGFEENAMEKPIILGKMYLGQDHEQNTQGGVGIIDTLLVRTYGEVPGGNTHYRYDTHEKTKLDKLETPRKVAYYILWLENLVKKYTTELHNNFTCFVSWVKWHFLPENLHIDDGDLGQSDFASKHPEDNDKFICYHKDDETCKICDNKDCINKAKTTYTDPKFIKPDTSLTYNPFNDTP